MSKCTSVHNWSEPGLKRQIGTVLLRMGLLLFLLLISDHENCNFWRRSKFCLAITDGFLLFSLTGTTLGSLILLHNGAIFLMKSHCDFTRFFKSPTDKWHFVRCHFLFVFIFLTRNFLLKEFRTTNNIQSWKFKSKILVYLSYLYCI